MNICKYMCMCNVLPYSTMIYSIQISINVGIGGYSTTVIHKYYSIRV